MPVELTELTNLFGNSFDTVWGIVLSYIPAIVLAIIVVLIGWVIGVSICRLIEKIFKSISIFDEALKNVGVEDLLQKAGLQLNVGRFIGIIVKIFIILVFLIAAFEIVGLNEINFYLRNEVLAYVPNVVVASLIVIAGAVVAEFVKNFIQGSARATKLRSAGFAGAVAKWGIWIFTILIALSQLGVATIIIENIIIATIAAFALAIGLAFGLGGQRAAADYIERTHNELKR